MIAVHSNKKHKYHFLEAKSKYSQPHMKTSKIHWDDSSPSVIKWCLCSDHESLGKHTGSYPLTARKHPLLTIFSYFFSCLLKFNSIIQAPFLAVTCPSGCLCICIGEKSHGQTCHAPWKLKARHLQLEAALCSACSAVTQAGDIVTENQTDRENHFRAVASHEEAR